MAEKQFSKADTDGSGEIDAKEIETFLIGMGLPFSALQVWSVHATRNTTPRVSLTAAHCGAGCGADEGP